MALFSRRCLQRMVDDLHDHPLVWRQKICRDIESGNVTTAFSFEAELAVCWALSKCSTLRPLGSVVFDGYPPDVVSDDLFPGVTAVVEVTMVSKGDLDVPGRYPMTLRRGPFGVGRSAVRNKIDDKDRKQMLKIPSECLRVLVIVDGGSRETEYPSERPMQWNAVGGAEAIAHAAAATNHTDIVAVLYQAPIRSGIAFGGQPAGREWRAHVVNITERVDPAPMRVLAGVLPPILALPSKLRWLARNDDWGAVRLAGTLPTGYRGGRMRNPSITVSARSLQKFLAAEQELDGYEKEAIRQLRAAVQAQTRKGRVLSEVQLESKGPDCDDDLIVLEFSSDPAFAPLDPGT